MNEKISLLELFSDLYDGEEADSLLKHNIVEDVDLRVKERAISLRVRSEVYLPLGLLSRMEQSIRELYDLKSVSIEARYDLELLERMDFADLTGLLAGFYPPAPAMLAGCRWERREAPSTSTCGATDCRS